MTNLRCDACGAALYSAAVERAQPDCTSCRRPLRRDAAAPRGASLHCRRFPNEEALRRADLEALAPPLPPDVADAILEAVFARWRAERYASASDS